MPNKIPSTLNVAGHLVGSSVCWSVCQSVGWFVSLLIGCQFVSRFVSPLAGSSLFLNGWSREFDVCLVVTTSSLVSTMLPWFLFVHLINECLLVVALCLAAVFRCVRQERISIRGSVPPSVRPSGSPSVRPSVRMSVRYACKKKTAFLGWIWPWWDPSLNQMIDNHFYSLLFMFLMHN